MKVVCINKHIKVNDKSLINALSALTINNVYETFGNISIFGYWIINDLGVEYVYDTDMFITLEEYRLIQIDKLI